MPRKPIGTQATHEIMRAFVVLSETLNLSEASEVLGLTRQTVRRYIDLFEEMKGAPLFTLKRNNYALTPLGEATVDEARYILRLTDRLCSSNASERRTDLHLDSATFVDDKNREFHIQQHPLSAISERGVPLLQRALKAWTSGSMRLEAKEMKLIRPYMIVYRSDSRGWLCMEIGEQSAYARWFGWTWSKSAVGKLSYQDEAGDDYELMVSETYAKVFGQGSARLDHIFAYMPRESEKLAPPATFQRLLMTCLLPDDTPVLVVLVALTNDVVFKSQEMPSPKVIPTELEMNFE